MPVDPGNPVLLSYLVSWQYWYYWFGVWTRPVTVSWRGDLDPSDGHFCCYLQHLVGVRAVLLERGAPEDSFCCYLQGFVHPQESRSPFQEVVTGHVRAPNQ